MSQHRLNQQRFSTDHDGLATALCEGRELLLIQDLDGVCMGLVRDPLTRSLERRYLEAVPALGRQFRVLTNGEHIGPRGVNTLVDAALSSANRSSGQGFYLPGLGGGGVQYQDAAGAVEHPGVSTEELDFLAAVPAQAASALDALLAEAPFSLRQAQREALLRSCILDNRVSPTLNLNPLFALYADSVERYQQLQHFALGFMRDRLMQAERSGLGDSFFLHLAPNEGRDEQGERLRLSDGRDAGTTDFQLMLGGAVKEVGVLVLLNRYLRERDGRCPLGEDFNARNAPSGHEALLELAQRAFRNVELPRLVGVGDTVTSHAATAGAAPMRGGSDRGFLVLVQELGACFGTDNATVFVDSSAGEVRRPGIDFARLHAGESVNWSALAGITDAQDPLKLNFLFPDGHRQYVEFFCMLAARFRARTSHHAG